MYTAITVLIILCCVLLVLVVLVQNPKGGGISSGIIGSNQVMGVKKTTDFIEKLTWGLALSLMVLCLFAGLTLPSREQQFNSDLQEKAASAPSQQGPAQQGPAQQGPAQQAPAQNAPQGPQPVTPQQPK
jgi:preprotein translocase subunit SecG